jgi:hypothetical protein
MVSGVVLTIGAPAVLAAGVGYGIYRLFGGGKAKR